MNHDVRIITVVVKIIIRQNEFCTLQLYDYILLDGYGQLSCYKNVRVENINRLRGNVVKNSKTEILEVCNSFSDVNTLKKKKMVRSINVFRLTLESLSAAAMDLIKSKISETL